jgi:VanZ family protein
MLKLPRFLSTPMLWRVLTLIWFGVLWWLSSQSFLPKPGDFEGADKWEHITFFAIGGTCFLLGLRLAGRARSFGTALGLTLAFCALIGVVDEWHQLYTPGRSGGDVWDWTADVTGGLVGTLVALLADRWLGLSARAST